MAVVKITANTGNYNSHCEGEYELSPKEFSIYTKIVEEEGDNE